MAAALDGDKRGGGRKVDVSLDNRTTPIKTMGSNFTMGIFQEEQVEAFKIDFPSVWKSPNACLGIAGKLKAKAKRKFWKCFKVSTETS